MACFPYKLPKIESDPMHEPYYPFYEDKEIVISEDLQKLIDLLRSNQEENKYIAISVAETQLGLDSYDLCCILKKIAMYKDSQFSSFHESLAFLEFFKLGGFIIESIELNSKHSFNCVLNYKAEFDMNNVSTLKISFELKNLILACVKDEEQGFYKTFLLNYEW